MESGLKTQRGRTRRAASTKATASHGSSMVLRISLRDIKPVIHRVVLIPGRITLPKLHVTILQAMGWEGGHLHEFIINGEHYGQPYPDFPEPEVRNEQRVRLEKALGGARRFEYLYDFGDAWWHRIDVLDVVPFASVLESPLCLDGACACPPEDVGGTPGYFHFVEAMTDPAHPEHHRNVEWYGDVFDPAAFDLGEVNERLMRIRL